MIKFYCFFYHISVDTQDFYLMLRQTPD